MSSTSTSTELLATITTKPESIGMFPWLPVEVLEKILEELWASPLTPSERLHLLRVLPTVNKTWSTIFARISMEDVFFACNTYADHYIYILMESFRQRTLPLKPSLFFLESVKNVHRCRSLTFQLGGKGVPTEFTPQKRMDNNMFNVFAFIYPTIHLQQLRRLRIEYTQWAFDDLFEFYPLTKFLRSITQLELVYNYRRSESSTWNEHARSTWARNHPRPSKYKLPSITELSVIGADTDIVNEIVNFCPNLKTLTMDGQPLPKFETPAVRPGETFEEPNWAPDDAYKWLFFTDVFRAILRGYALHGTPFE